MRRAFFRMMAGGATVAAAVGLTGTPAHALSWTVSPVTGFVAANVAPNPFDASTQSIVLRNHRQDLRFPCTTSRVDGTVPSGSDADGINVLRITSLTLSGCTFGPYGSFTFASGTSATNPSWLSVTETTYTPPQVDARLDGFGGTFTGSGCMWTFGGPLTPVDKPRAALTGYYDNSTRQLVLTGGGDLTVRSVSGCFGSVLVGDTFSLYGRYQFSPAITITSP